MSIILFLILIAFGLAYKNLSNEHELALDINETYVNKTMELEKEIFGLKKSIQLNKEENRDLKTQLAYIKNANQSLSDLLRSQNESIFYDKQNDVIVTMDNLHRIGDI